MISYKGDTFPDNDDVYLKIRQKLEPNKDISIQIKINLNPVFGYSINNPMQSLAAIIVYPKDQPIYSPEDLNRFAEDNLFPLFDSSFVKTKAQIIDKSVLGYIPMPEKSIMTLPLLKKKDVFTLEDDLYFPEHEFHYHIILFPEQASASQTSIINSVYDCYSIKTGYINTAQHIIDTPLALA